MPNLATQTSPPAWEGKKVLWWLVFLTLSAAVIRSYHLDNVSLRGDEAFTVRFWAQSPSTTWNELAAWEPHPYGTFVLFWAWKSLAGESEFAMRALPLLLNLLGVAVMMVLGRRFIGTESAVWMLGLLWAVNPFQVWHAQDVRNYAIWSALSPLSFWLFLVAVERNRPRYWIAYGVVGVLACYSFLLEPFFLLVQGLFLLLFHRDKLRQALITWAGMSLALIPLFIQLVRLANHGYAGTATKVSVSLLVESFLPTLLFGEGKLSFVAGLALILVLIVGLVRGKRHAEQRYLLLMWLFIPLGLLTLTSTRMSIFLPRYIIPITPPLLLGLLWIAYRGGGRAHRYPALPLLVTATLTVIGIISLNAYFFTDPPKAPDWRGMAHFLDKRTGEQDLIVLANTDPAFDYYYRGVALALPWTEVPDAPQLLKQYQGVFIQVNDATSPLSLALQAQAQFIPPSGITIKQYRPYDVTPDEIQFPLAVRLGGVAILRGYSLQGMDNLGVTVLLYWEPLAQTETEMVGFVHVPHPSGVGLLAQDDHPPLNGFANTTVWHVGDLLRDAFYLPLPSGQHQLVVGMYDSTNTQPLPIYYPDGSLVGESYGLVEIGIP